MLGIIGGSGVQNLEGINWEGEIDISTPFGQPSSPVKLGEIGGKKIAFITRHGPGHTFTPTEVPYRANIWALKKVGVTAILSVSAVGSLKEEFAPGDFVIIDDFIDKTFARENTFFKDLGVVAHTPLAPAACPTLKEIVKKAAKEAGVDLKEGGVYVCIEGPQFSTMAESKMHQQWGASIVGMTNATEFRLAREAGLCYLSISMVTDYDVWKEHKVDAQEVLKVMAANISKAQKLIPYIVKHFDDNPECVCHLLNKNAVVTDPTKVTDDIREIIDFLLE